MAVVTGVTERPVAGVPGLMVTTAETIEIDGIPHRVGDEVLLMDRWVGRVVRYRITAIHRPGKREWKVSLRGRGEFSVLAAKCSATPERKAAAVAERQAASVQWIGERLRSEHDVSLSVSPPAEGSVDAGSSVVLGAFSRPCLDGTASQPTALRNGSHGG